MRLEINYSKKTGTIKHSFNKMFPFLKIEFFNIPHAPGEPTAKKHLVSDETTLGEITGILKEGSVTIHPEDKVSSIEQLFQQKFGLSIHIFRKQHDVWIETTKTDELTLATQNEKGRVASAPQIQTAAGDRYLEDGQY